MITSALETALTQAPLICNGQDMGNCLQIMDSWIYVWRYLMFYLLVTFWIYNSFDVSLEGRLIHLKRLIYLTKINTCRLKHTVCETAISLVFIPVLVSYLALSV